MLVQKTTNMCAPKALFKGPSLAYSQTRPQTYSQIKPQIIELDLPTKDNKVGEMTQKVPFVILIIILIRPWLGRMSRR